MLTGGPGPFAADAGVLKPLEVPRGERYRSDRLRTCRVFEDPISIYHWSVIVTCSAVGSSKATARKQCGVMWKCEAV